MAKFKIYINVLYIRLNRDNICIKTKHTVKSWQHMHKNKTSIYILHNLYNIEMSAIIARITNMSDCYLLSTTRLLSEWDTRFRGYLDKAGYISRRIDGGILGRRPLREIWTELSSTVTHSKFCHGAPADRCIGTYYIKKKETCLNLLILTKELMSMSIIPLLK